MRQLERPWKTLGHSATSALNPPSSSSTTTWRISQRGEEKFITKEARDSEDESAKGSERKADFLTTRP